MAQFMGYIYILYYTFHNKLNSAPSGAKYCTETNVSSQPPLPRTLLPLKIAGGSSHLQTFKQI